MGKLVDRDIETILKRIEKSFPALEILQEVFSPEEQKMFISALQVLSQDGNTIKVGGRRLRELLGCKTIDLSADIVSDASEIGAHKEHRYLRLQPLISILEAYPTERMSRPDLDLFIWEADSENILALFRDLGFKVSKHQATGGVWVINVEGTNGCATFVDGDMSWQTGESWPMFGFLAQYNNIESSFELDISSARINTYPLEIPNINKANPLDPQRVAAIGRALLWLVTVATPDHKRLRLPFDSTEKYFFETIAALPGLLREVSTNPYLETKYRSGLRDLAIALRIIVLSDWDEIVRVEGLSLEYDKFFEAIQDAWQSALWATFES